MSNKTINIELLEWQAKIVLLSLAERENQLKIIVDNSTDEDAIADASNDLVELKMVQKHMLEHGLEASGPR